MRKQWTISTYLAVIVFTLLVLLYLLITHVIHFIRLRRELTFDKPDRIRSQIETQTIKNTKLSTSTATANSNSNSNSNASTSTSTSTSTSETDATPSQEQERNLQQRGRHVSSSSSSAMRRRRKHRPHEKDSFIFECIDYKTFMSSLIIVTIVLNIIYLSLKLRIQLIKYDIEYKGNGEAWSSTSTNCHALILSYVVILAISVWMMEFFFLNRGLKLAMDSVNVYGSNSPMIKCNLIACKIGVCINVFGLLCTVVCMLVFVDYSVVDINNAGNAGNASQQRQECISDGKQKNENLITATRVNIAIYVVVFLLALNSFIQPLIKYRHSLSETTAAAAQTPTESKSAAVQKSIQTQNALTHTIWRVCISSLITHLAVVICTVFCVLIVTEHANRNAGSGSGSGGYEWFLRSVFAFVNVLEICLMDLTFGDWKARIFPCLANANSRKG